MGTIAEKLNYLNTTKANIKNAIIEKGVSVSDNDTFRSYASKIADIEPTLGTKTITANGTYTASDDSLQGYSSVTVDIDDTDLYRDTTDSTYESVKTLSNCGAFPMLSLTAEINAVQDLHGYDAPWVGGAGKNKFDIDAEHTDTSGAYAYELIVKPNTAYTMSSNVPQSNPASLYFNGGTTDVNGVWSGTSRTFTSDENGKLIAFVTTGTTQGVIDLYTAVKNGQYYIQLEEGTEATTYSPYSNICPITGWDSIDVCQSGVNVWDEEWEVGAISDSNGLEYALAERVRSKNYIIVKPNTPYYLYLPNTYSSARIACYDKDKTYLGQATGWLSVNNNTAFTTPSNTYYIRFVVVKTDETYNNDISINYPSTDTEYHAYNGQTYTIQFKDGDNPLTVYGGTLDVTSGELVVTYAKKALADISKSKYGGYSYGIRVITNFFDSIPNSSLLTGMSNTFVLSNSDESYFVDRCTILFANGQSKTSFLISTQASELSADATVAEVNEWLRSIDAYFVYPLASPQTYQLTPTQVKLLLGINNLWANSGDVGDARYFRKVEL